MAANLTTRAAAAGHYSL